MNESSPDSHLILFDCDGTLTDSHGAIVTSMQRAFTDSGLAPPDDASVRAIIGLSLKAAVVVLSSEPTLNEKISSSYRDHYVAAELSLRLFPGVVETLELLKERGYRMGIVTGKSKAGLLRVMVHFGLNEYFTVFRTADCCHSKPHPAMALECMQELGFTVENTSLVGDALFDMQMAAAAGIRAYGVSFGVEPADALYVAGAYHVVDEFSALLECFPPLNPDKHQATISTTGV